MVQSEQGSRNLAYAGSQTETILQSMVPNQIARCTKRGAFPIMPLIDLLACIAIAALVTFMVWLS